MTVSGDLDQVIYLQMRDPSVNALREQSKAWITFTPNGVFAQAITLRNREFVAAGGQQEEITIKFRVRRRTDVTAQMRLLWKDVPYDIVGPPLPVQGGREFIDLMAKSGTRDGRNPNG